ncbi:MAG: ABC transporter ATP-binding protein [Ectothiorhodospiraceae bacterium]|nr:ABC transporter ATP-binding protein [Ectothiorhodospiraceae bacterium]
MPDDSLVLRVSDLHFGYPGRPVLRGLNLEIRNGEIFTLLGPNGAGKTTLVKLLCGRFRPASGFVELLGRTPGESASARRALGLVPQEIALYPHLTARENLQTFARLAGVTRSHIAEAVNFALSVTGLDSRSGQQVRQLSGGYQRRVNIAAAIVHRPRLMLLDEPTVGVDIDARQAIQQLVRTLAHSGMAVLLTTHDMDQAASLSDRVGFLLEGRVDTQGAPDALLTQAFGDRRELRITLEREPAAAQQKALAAHGLAATADARIWWGESHAGSEPADALTGALETAGMQVRELRLRRPDLSSLFQRLTATRGVRR